ncbi:MAG: hypothetical protein IJ856_00155, partial [Candidatus Methanomethylophilaceae archaeon]|nr:hypothetical protein [Candidatus Methanomethylophilaceae archaeon]
EDEVQRKEDRRRMAKSAMYCFLATVFPLVPTVLPLLIIEDLGAALLTSSVVAAVTMFVVGCGLGKYVGMKGWKCGLLVAGMAMGITLVATFTGG